MHRQFAGPRDIIRVDLDTGVTLFWEVEGVYLGAEGQESVTELSPVGQSKHRLPGEADTKTLIPSQMLDIAISKGAFRCYSP